MREWFATGLQGVGEAIEVDGRPRQFSQRRVSAQPAADDVHELAHRPATPRDHQVTRNLVLVRHSGAQGRHVHRIQTDLAKILVGVDVGRIDLRDVGHQSRDLLEACLRFDGHTAAVAFQMREQRATLTFQRVHGLGAERHDLGTAGRDRRNGLPVLLENDVGVDAAVPEGTDARSSRQSIGVGGPRSDLARDRERGRTQVQKWRHGTKVGLRCDDPVPQRQEHLREGRHAGGRLKVTHIGLHRTEGTTCPWRRVMPIEGLNQTFDLDRIAKPGASAVSLDVVGAGDGDIGLVPRGLDDVGLGLRRWSGQ